jgi:hypothetical protein
MKVPRSARRRFLQLFAALALAGCAGVPVGLKPPEVSVADISLIGGGLLEQRFIVRLRLINPNNRDISIEGVSFRLDLADHEFARGVSSRPVKLPRLGEATMDVEAVTRLADVLGLARGRDGKAAPDLAGAISYHLSGQLATGRYVELPFERKGELRLPGWLVGS